MQEKSHLTTGILLEGKALSKIAYSEKPLPQGGEIKYLTPEEFQKKFNFTYSECLFGNKEELKDYFNVKMPPSDLPRVITSEDIKYRLRYPLECFVICNTGSTGHGLFTTKDLQSNTVLFMYSGVIRNATASDGEYDYRWVKNFDLPPKGISAKESGGLSRFMQHLPLDHDKIKRQLKEALTEQFGPEIIKQRGVNLDEFINELMQNKCSDHELQDYIFRKKSMREKIQGSNVKLSEVILDGIPLIACWTEYGVKANEQVGFSYGEGYWKATKKQPRYYKQDGTLIPLYEYNLFSTGIMKETNPVKIFNEGAKLQKEGAFHPALIAFSQALSIFREKTGKDSLKCGDCYSALASNYRDTKDYYNALHACEKAIVIFATLNETDKLSKARNKYLECLTLCQPNLKTLYGQAAANINRKKYLPAIDKLEFILSSEASEDVKAYCHSALASCYRETKDIEKAISHCKTAIIIRKKIKSDQSSISSLEQKLEKLLKINEEEVQSEKGLQFGSL